MAGIKGKVSAKGLEEFKNSLKKLDEKQRRQWSEAALKDLAARLLAKTIKRTPVGEPPRPDAKERTVKAVGASGKKKTFLSAGEARWQQYWSGYQGGTLRAAWTVGEVRRTGDGYAIEVINPMEYAPYVEFGHRQTPGRWVPQIGKALKESWVEGRFMLTVSEAELRADAPGILAAKLKKFLEGALK